MAVRLCLGGLFLFVLATLGMAADPDQAEDRVLFMPPDFSLPVAADPRPDPHDADSNHPGFAFPGPGQAVHEINLDPTPRKWMGTLLTLRVGTPDPANWGLTHQLYALGLPGASSGTRPVAQLGDEVLVFDGTFIGQPEKVLHAIGDQQITLRMDGTDVLLSTPDRLWRFAWMPEEAIWRPSQVSLIRQPNHSMTLTYDRGLLTGIVLTNGQMVSLVYRDGLLERVEAPFGQETQLERDRTGRVTRVTRSVRPDRSEGPPYQVATYRYEYDDQNRLTTLIDAYGGRWSMRYDQQSLRDVTVHQVQIQSQVDLGYVFQQYEIAGNGRHSRTIGAGRRGQPIDKAIEEYAFATVYADPQVIGPAAPTRTSPPIWLSSLLKQPISAIRYRISLLSWAPLIKMDEPETGIIMEHDADGRLIAYTDASGTKTVYVYTAAGELVEARVEGDRKPHQFAVDEWGRVVKHTLPDGVLYEWVFDPYGRMTQMKIGTPLAGDPEDLLAAQRFKWDETQFVYGRSGLLAEIHRPSGERDTFTYDGQRLLTTHRLPSGQTTRYRFDRHGRLAGFSAQEGAREDFTFYADGRLAAHDQQTRGSLPRRTREYDPQGRVAAETVQGLGKTQYMYDEQGRQYRTIHPDGTDTVYTFDELGRILTIRGSHQPPVNIRYDEHGRREIIPVRQ